MDPTSELLMRPGNAHCRGSDDEYKEAEIKFTVVTFTQVLVILLDQG